MFLSLLSPLLLLGLSPQIAHAEVPSLVWLADGRMLLDGRWLLRPDAGKAQPLLYPTQRRLSDGSLASLSLDVSPSGQVSLLDHGGQGVFLGLLDGALFAHVPLPTLAVPPAEARHAAVWVDDRYLLLYQMSPRTGDAACALLDVQQRAWQPPLSACPASDFVQISHIVRGPGDWMVVHSTSEGASSALLQRWNPTQGVLEEIRLPLAPEAALAGTIEVFLVDGGFRLLAPCGLQGQGCTDDQAVWWLYDWLPTGELRPLRDDLPFPVIPVPGAVDLAWPEEDRICLGNPTGERRCLPTPERP